MAVPKRKTTPSKRNMRRAHDRMVVSAHTICDNSGELRLRHHISTDGTYRGKQIIQPKAEAPAE